MKLYNQEVSEQVRFPNTDVPPYRDRAAEVQDCLWQYRNRPIGAVSDVFGFSSKPQPHSHLDIDCKKHVSSFRSSGSPDYLCSTAISIASG
ncbi:hypothetical protein BDQ94DRAFT_177413 [Aspergillus welwitschiae]|uniref:Uncharacterized protein n=1 Tax=Aspergillus welwitschiae TaxID=1341132 RepID=A0A3F3PI00_9EURO|nr:hypothetical protein BDQ94DRAFT_177413 [Aspergillus welwitschiae]RDH26585.1 hypothetical protein BDQ94DRAFT_177413 [Aspergillus welwitschiae]